MRLAVTGSAGRLGSALVAKAVSRPSGQFTAVLGWSRPEVDLDRPETLADLVRRTRPDLVIHAAAWTDVDGCATEPTLAMRRNGEATGVLAGACAAAGVDLVYVSTNEVFDGLRTDGRGYVPTDPVGPINGYGASKLAGEEAARGAYGAMGSEGPRLTIVRTAWLFGPPGADFPSKIVSAALRARERGDALRLVADEVGSPTYAADLARAIVDFVARGPIDGTFHVVNAGRASRADWAREVLRLHAVEVALEDVRSADWPRPSRPPLWAVLESSAAFGDPLRDWREALAASLRDDRRMAAGLA